MVLDGGSRDREEEGVEVKVVGVGEPRIEKTGGRENLSRRNRNSRRAV